MALPGSGGKMVPEYTAAEVKGWLDTSALGIGGLASTVVIALFVVGLLLFAGGLVKYMRDQAQDANSMMGAGGQGRGSVTMMAAGVALALVDVIAVVVYAVLRPATT